LASGDSRRPWDSAVAAVVAAVAAVVVAAVEAEAAGLVAGRPGAQVSGLRLTTSL
jgi:hypothetical protein